VIVGLGKVNKTIDMTLNGLDETEVKFLQEMIESGRAAIESQRPGYLKEHATTFAVLQTGLRDIRRKLQTDDNLPQAKSI
jgi:hypothetical protein